MPVLAMLEKLQRAPAAGAIADAVPYSPELAKEVEDAVTRIESAERAARQARAAEESRSEAAERALARIAFDLD